jgi:hypothetical protein
VSTPFSYVQGAGSKATGAVSSQAVTMSGSVTPGDIVFAWSSAFMSTSSATMGATDNKGGNTWNNLGNVTIASGEKLSLFASVIVNGGTGFTVTITPSTSTFFPSAGIDEFTFPGFTVAQDGATVTNTGTASTQITTGTLTPTGTDLIYAVGGGTGPITWSSANLTLTFTSGGTSGQNDAGAGGYSLNATSPVNPAFNASPGFVWGAIGVQFVATAAGSVGTASGSSTASGVGVALVASAGTASGTSTASAVGASLAKSAGSAAASSAASGVSGAAGSAAGTAAGSSTATATGAAFWRAIGAAQGSSLATAVGESIIAAIGTANGSSTASGVSPSGGVASATGTANGSSTASGVSLGVILFSVDPRAGTILSLDTDPLAVNPRQGTILN